MKHCQTSEYSAEILVVDDTLDQLRLLTSLLKEQGYKVRPVSSGMKAISAVQASPPDLILLDIMMPEMDGYEVCRRLKTDDHLRDIPVIFLSALGELSSKLQGFELGGVDYITKPFQEEEVLARVCTHIQIISQQREIKEQQLRFQRLAEATFEGILIHEHGIIVEINHALELLFGYTREEVIGRDAFDLLPPESREIAAERVRSGDERPYQVWGITRDGTRIPLEVQGKTMQMQGHSYRVLAMRDISWRTILEQEQRALDIVLDDQEKFGHLVGKSQIMRTVYEFILRAAASRAPVIIYGETGAGKELTARTIFELSEHHTANFVIVNCASIPENLFESLFFGHTKGAFTGAEHNADGYFEQARGGTLFLDEVGDLPLAMQAKLLRVLEGNAYTPVGARKSQKSDVRIIAATNKELRTLVRQGKIRSDFFHRLHVLAIDLPPLRERKEDIPLLLKHFLTQQTEIGNCQVMNFPPSLLKRFEQYDWPGNVRELFNEFRRYLATGKVELSGSLPAKISRAAEAGPAIQDNLPLNDAIEQFEYYYIPRILKRYEGHKGKTAEILGIDRKTLYRKLKKFGLI